MASSALLLTALLSCSLAVTQTNQTTEIPTTQQPEEPLAKPDVYWMHINSDIQYRYAHTTIRSRVANTAAKAQEYLFHVVLPDPAFITGFVMTIKEKNYTAYVKEKEEAKKEYDQAVSQGLSAAHVAYNARDSNEFKVSINIEPQGKVDFTLTYDELLRRELGQYKHEINVHPGQIVDDLKITVNIQDVLPITNVQVPELKISNEISPEEVPNALAKIQQEQPENVTIKWAPSVEEQKELKAEGVSGQFVVKYDVDRSSSPQQILVNDGYFVHFFADDALPSLNKHVVFVLDISGSMAGRKMAQLKTAMNKILTDLKPTDYFSIVVFSNKADVWSPDKNTKEMLRRVGYGSYHQDEDEKPSEVGEDNIVPVDEEHIKAAKGFIEDLDDAGGTNIIAGLRLGLKLTKLGAGKFAAELEGTNKPHPVVVFLTDGEPNIEESNPKAITNKTTTQNDAKNPIFSLGFGNGADIKFLRSLSLSNNGFARHIYEASDAALQLDKFFQSISSPKLTDVKFIYPDEQVTEDKTKSNFPGLYSGSELMVAGRLPDGQSQLTGKLTAEGAEGIKEFTLPPIREIMCPPIEPPEAPTPANRTYGPLEKMWAYQSIKQLLEKNSISEDKDAKQKALELALKYSFVTKLTSLVVVKPNETTAVDAEEAGRRHSWNPGMVLSAVAPSFGFSGAPGVPSAPGLQGPPPGGFGGGAYGLSQDMDSMALPANINKFQSVSNMKTVTKVDYKNVTWLATDIMEKEGQFFIKPPASVSDTALIALNETSTPHDRCTIDGANGHCKHFIHCTLNLFADNIDIYNNEYKCLVTPQFVGVCCPDSLGEDTVP